MTRENYYKLFQLIKKREELAKKLKHAYNDKHNLGSQTLEIQYDNIRFKIEKIIFPPVIGRYAEYG
jgi:hypothetical protein